jgi:hypothetical protein
MPLFWGTSGQGKPREVHHGVHCSPGRHRHLSGHGC